MINQRLLTLLAASILLAAWYFWQGGGIWFGDRNGTSEVSAPPPAPATADATAPAGQLVRNPLHELNSAQLPDIAARPLFNPTRAPRPAPEPVADNQPPPEKPAPQPPEVNPADYELLAVAGGGTGLVAVVRFVPENRIYHLRKGQFLSDWQVAEVEGRSVKLDKAEKSFEITMFKPPAEAQPSGGSEVAPPANDSGDQPPPDAGADGAGTDAPQQ